MTTGINYRYMQTECRKCHIIDDFTTDNMYVRIGDIWDQECVTKYCQGDSVIVGAGKARPAEEIAN